MIDGVTILATEVVEVMHPTLEIIGWLAIPLIFIGIISALKLFNALSNIFSFSSCSIEQVE